MTRVRSAVQVFALVALATGCYHMTIDTGLAPSTTVIDRPWALGFVYGLVPPPTIETIQRCPKGIAKVETQQDAVNAVVSFFTGGILTPWHVKVTCALDGTTRAAALGTSVIDLGSILTPDLLRDGLVRAADVAAETGQPAAVKR